MDINNFINKVQSEFGLNAEFSSEKMYPKGEYETTQSDITKSYLNVGDLKWFGIGYNLADANQTAIDKACKYLNWD